MRIKLISALGALALACPSSALSEPLTIETLLGLESFGRIDIDPSGSVAVFEERRARGDLPRYDLQPEGALRYARLYRFDVDMPSEIRPLLPRSREAVEPGPALTQFGKVDGAFPTGIGMGFEDHPFDFA